MGAGDDTLIATGSGETITGAQGIDTLTGIGGIDTFVFNQGDSARGNANGNAAQNIDVITDFGVTDFLDLSLIGTAFNYTDGGLYLNYTAFLAAADAALDGTTRYFFAVYDNDANGIDAGDDGWLAVSYNPLTGVADEVIQLTGFTALAAGDII